MAEKVIEKTLEPWKSLNGKIVMVTGASSGLGLEFCLDLAKAGCKIIAAARRTDRLKSLCEEINKKLMNSSSGELVAVAVELDLTASGSVIDESVQKAWDAFGRIDALINNGGFRGGVNSAIDLSEEEWKNVIATNLTGTWLVSKSVCRRSRAANLKISVINISSIAGLQRGQLPGGIAYAASKTAMNSITKVMALELGANGIRVNAICPGLFKSEITEQLMQKKWLKKIAERTVPLKKFGETDPALTSLVRFLIHDSSEYITGNEFIVDAGQTLPGVPIFSSL